MPDPPRRRRGRGIARADELFEKLANEGRLEINFDVQNGTYKAVGPNYKFWDTALGLHTRRLTEPFHDTWRKVPAQHKTLIQNRMRICMINFIYNIK